MHKKVKELYDFAIKEFNMNRETFEQMKSDLHHKNKFELGYY